MRILGIFKINNGKKLCEKCNDLEQWQLIAKEKNKKVTKSYCENHYSKLLGN